MHGRTQIYGSNLSASDEVIVVDGGSSCDVSSVNAAGVTTGVQSVVSGRLEIANVEAANAGMYTVCWRPDGWSGPYEPVVGQLHVISECV